MFLTQCAACAAPLGLTLGKKCGRCSTRYCGPECQKQHWEEGGHDKICKKIKKAGGAEQFHANKQHADAVAVAVEACAEDTKGQTCFICTQALHWKTKEGLVRGCACRGTAGFAHVSCLAEQAKILVVEALENNLREEVKTERWNRWHTCSLCEQLYHGDVKCALGWACWKTYLGRPEGDKVRILSMQLLGNGLTMAGYHEAALAVREAELATRRRLGASALEVLRTQGNLACTYEHLGRREEASRMKQSVYFGYLTFGGEENKQTLVAAHNYAESLLTLESFEEAKALLRKTMRVVRRVVSENDELTLRMRCIYAEALYKNDRATLDDLREAVTTLEDVERTARRVLGGAHPFTTAIESGLLKSRAVLRDRET